MYISLPIQLITPEAAALGIEPPVVALEPAAPAGPVWTGKLIVSSGNDTQYNGEYGFPVEYDGTYIHNMYVPGVTDAIDYAVVQFKSLAVIKANGTLWTCGSNADGQLGTGNTTVSYTQYGLAQVGTDTDWVWISSGDPNPYLNIYWALKANGDLYWWGKMAYTEGPAFNPTPTLLASGMGNLTRISLDTAGFVVYHLESGGTSIFKYGGIPSIYNIGHYTYFPWSGKDPDTETYDSRTLHDLTLSGISDVKYFIAQPYGMGTMWHAIKYNGDLYSDYGEFGGSTGAYQNYPGDTNNYTQLTAGSVVNMYAKDSRIGYIDDTGQYVHSYLSGAGTDYIYESTFISLSGSFYEAGFLITNTGYIYEGGENSANTIYLSGDRRVIDIWSTNDTAGFIAAEGTGFANITSTVLYDDFENIVLESLWDRAPPVSWISRNWQDFAGLWQTADPTQIVDNGYVRGTSAISSDDYVTVLYFLTYIQYNRSAPEGGSNPYRSAINSKYFDAVFNITTPSDSADGFNIYINIYLDGPSRFYCQITRDTITPDNYMTIGADLGETTLFNNMIDTTSTPFLSGTTYEVKFKVRPLSVEIYIDNSLLDTIVGYIPDNAVGVDSFGNIKALRIEQSDPSDYDGVNTLRINSVDIQRVAVAAP